MTSAWPTWPAATTCVDWDAACHATVALLRAEAGREPHDRALRELIGELSTLSPEFRHQWAAHDVRIRHDGIKRLRHPEVGDLELNYHSLDLRLTNGALHDLTTYTAEPATTSEERLRLLASWATPQHQAAEPTQEHA
ncbi:DNA-binding protein [Streptomyces sp. NBC_01166]|uniref:MmyB family transcriptional regulator n=1 Tax=Streptomyces sp. NBC_01166 TaxID=2903755 RepID=UPI0038668DD7|nr:DNA-binding protein [Streptomyces sp. NBC_01166]